MSQEGSVAPKERVNIVYKSATGGATAEKELPLKLLMMGDYTQRADDTPLEDRKRIQIDKDNFNDVMKSQNLKLDFAVDNTLTEEEGDDMAVSLNFKSLADFGPESVARQVPELRKLLEMREALTALKGQLSFPDFQRRLQGIVDDKEKRAQLLSDIGTDDGDEG